MQITARSEEQYTSKLRQPCPTLEAYHAASPQANPSALLIITSEIISRILAFLWVRGCKQYSIAIPRWSLRLLAGRRFGVLDLENQFDLLDIVLAAIKRGGYRDQLKRNLDASLNVGRDAEGKRNRQLAEIE